MPAERWIQSSGPSGTWLSIVAPTGGLAHRNAAHLSRTDSAGSELHRYQRPPAAHDDSVVTQAIRDGQVVRDKLLNQRSRDAVGRTRMVMSPAVTLE
jgi:hypothetical protein